MISSDVRIIVKDIGHIDGGECAVTLLTKTVSVNIIIVTMLSNLQ